MMEQGEKEKKKLCITKKDEKLLEINKKKRKRHGKITRRGAEKKKVRH